MRRLIPPVIVLCLMIVVYVIAIPSYGDRLALALAPSAERAYRYGTERISSSDPSYNLHDALYFFSAAASMEPTYPYVHHQLARIAFLNADYPAALVEINTEIANDPEKTRSSPYYMRGLIEGYLNQYDAAVRDYKQFVELEPARWEGRTDYAWVLIKTKQYSQALSVIDTGLAQTPGNPWLLSMRATILFESGRITEALPAARAAKTAVDSITEEMWLKAYPGNAPGAAAIGIKTLRDAAAENLKKIEAAASQ